MKNKNIGLYIHIPFCKKKCPYCDFYSVSLDESLIREYIKKLCCEFVAWSKKCKKTVDTIYFGGGTPSLLVPEQIDFILSNIIKNFNISKVPEITVEVNPADYTFEDYQKLKNAGINRVSLGAQSLFDDELNFLGRRHNSEDVLGAVESIKKAGFKNISVDLILGVPGQTKEKLIYTFNFLRRENITHISAYMLKIEENTPFFSNEKFLNLPSEEFLCDLYLCACEELKKQGFNQYEISNFALEDFESKHNLKYWNMEDYLGFGPSSHSFFEGKRFFYGKNIKNFTIIYEEETNFEEEFIMLKLRLSKGLENSEFKKTFDKNIPQAMFEKAKKYAEKGYLTVDQNSIELTPKGFLISNIIIADLITL